MASFDHPSALHKRSRYDSHPLPDPMPKRLCPEPKQASPHLSFLEEFCDLEASLDTSALVSSTQDKLVAEMMKSLEKVIGDGEETSTSQEPSPSQASSEPSSTLTITEPSTSALDSTWQYLCLEKGNGVPCAEPAGCSSYGEFDFECGQSFAASDASENMSDDQIRHLLEVSDDELGIPVTSRNFPAQQGENEWALFNQGGPDDSFFHALGVTGWLDGSFHQFEDTFPVARDLREVLF